MTARSTVSSLVSVSLGDGAAEVDGSEGGEDERLQGGDQADLEEEERRGRRAAVIQPSAAIPSRTASAPPMNRMIRWPARMLANSRTESDMQPHEVREQLEHEDEAGHAARGRPPGIRLLR